MIDASKRSLIFDTAPKAAAAVVCFWAGDKGASAQSRQPSAKTEQHADKHVIFALDMSGSVSIDEARAMQKMLKEAILEHFSDAANKGASYALTVIDFATAANVGDTRVVRNEDQAKKFINDYLWDLETDQPVALKNSHSGRGTNIFQTLRVARSVFSRVTSQTKDLVFVLDGWQQPHAGDQNIVRARESLEAEGVSVHAMAVGRLESFISPRTGRAYGWGDIHGDDQASSIKNLLVTPKGKKYSVSEEFGGRVYQSEGELTGSYVRSEDFENIDNRDPKNPTKTLKDQIKLIMNLSRN